jgi:Ricin-type beta-trefoil lectin domain/Subtilase family
VRTMLLARRTLVVATAGALGALCVSAAAVASVPASAHAPASRYSPGDTGRPLRAHPALTHVIKRAALPAGEHYVCPAPTRPGQMTCMSIINTGKSSSTEPAVAGAKRIKGYSPADLRSAYKLTSASARDGHGRTIAIVDAYSDPDAARDLAVYRAHYHLPACTLASRCLRILDEHGKASPLPKANWDWAAEESLDLDMVSAICPNCHILLVEATNPSTVSLGTAEQTAVKDGARYVSNSWDGGEFTGQDVYDHYFNHPGVVVDFASGDYDYGPGYPSDLQYVTSIGGTSLRHDHNARGWTEKVWGPGTRLRPEGTGSGCSALEAKPSWQKADDTSPDGCLNRTENDVAADADPNTGVAMYDTYPSNLWPKGWNEFGGTSEATPIITSIYALAGTPARGSYPAEYPYLHVRSLFNVPTGSNGRCESYRQYLCNGERGYNGPTGNGTPDGTTAFTDDGAHLVTLTDPGTQDVGSGAHFSLRITGFDTRSASGLRYSATGLPAGLSIRAVAHSTDARITGTAGTPGTFKVAVTAKDGSVTGSTHFTLVITPALAAAGTPSVVRLRNGSSCLDDSGGGIGAAVDVRTCTGGSVSQEWTYRSDGRPDDTGTLHIGGLCLGLSGSRGVLASCAGERSEEWQYLGVGELGNVAAGKCLSVPSVASGTAVDLASCDGTALQSWRLPLGPLVSATSLCLDDPVGPSSPSTKVEVSACTGAGGQEWLLLPNGTISTSKGPEQGMCLSGRESLLSGTPIVLTFCDTSSSSPDYSELWVPGPGGELINEESGRCLADPDNGPAGTALRQEDCYGEAGEVWGVN